VSETWLTDHYRRGTLKFNHAQRGGVHGSGEASNEDMTSGGKRSYLA
jgi:hypothetical protein